MTTTDRCNLLVEDASTIRRYNELGNGLSATIYTFLNNFKGDIICNYTFQKINDGVTEFLKSLEAEGTLICYHDDLLQWRVKANAFDNMEMHISIYAEAHSLKYKIDLNYTYAPATPIDSIDIQLDFSNFWEDDGPIEENNHESIKDKYGLI